MEPPAMKFNRTTGEVAIKAADDVAYEWFVFDPANGGRPTSALRIERWEDLWPAP